MNKKNKMYRNIVLIILVSITSYSCKPKNSQNLGWSYNDGVHMFENAHYELGFKAAGHSPEWKVELVNETIVYSDIRLVNPINYKWVRSYPLNDGQGMMYVGGDTTGDTIQVRFQKSDCRDTFEDRTYPFQVDVTRNSMNSESGERGCGVYIEDSHLEGEWWIYKMNGSKVGKTNNGNYGVITFNTKDDSFGAQISCNSMGGSYVPEENILFIGENMITTLMMCNKHMNLEEELAASLSGKSITYSFINQDEMVLRSKGKVILELKRAK